MTRTVDPVLAYLLDDLVALAPFGLSIEVTFLVSGVLIVGTPIADEEYFARLGERVLSESRNLSDLYWHSELRARVEKQRGWSEELVARFGNDRELAFRRFGEQIQERLRQHVQARPQRLLYTLTEESARQEEFERSDKLFGNQAEPDREYIHLRDVRVYGTSLDAAAHPIWRVRLSDVSGWYLSSPHPD